jgi:hypothetical protein
VWGKATEKNNQDTISETGAAENARVRGASALGPESDDTARWSERVSLCRKGHPLLGGSTFFDS